jgi:hypothetical protein
MHYSKAKYEPSLTVRYINPVQDREQIDKLLSAKLGVFCMSEEPENMLMWSHYAGSHTRICIEYDSHNEPFRNAAPIKYVDEFPKPDRDRFYRGDMGQLQQLMLAKSTCWAYEKEWRLVCQMPGGYSDYAQFGIKSIRFGSRCDDSMVKIVKSILTGKPIGYFRLIKNDARYSLHSVPIKD